jgi:hypothetical protein
MQCSRVIWCTGIFVSLDIISEAFRVLLEIVRKPGREKVWVVLVVMYTFTERGISPAIGKVVWIKLKDATLYKPLID